MAYHLLIQSAASAHHTQNTIQSLLAEGKPIQQIFFYFHGVQQVFDMTLAKEWDKLIQLKIALKVCKTAWMDSQQPTLPSGFMLSSVIDFFSVHWQDQGVLRQF